MLSVKNQIILIFLLFSGSILHAQLNATTIGDAVNQGDNCFIITQDLDFQSGGVWYDNAIDFDNDFTINYQNNFGNKDNDGADGMALVFKRNSTPQLGNAGGGMGYQGIAESLIIEFDTYQNNIPSEGLLADPFFDHIAIQRDGNPFHNNSSANLAGPIQASLTSQNIEDGNTHEIKIDWNATTEILSVFFDCELRLTLNLDIKNVIFSDDDSVFFGFVGSTGGLSNLHQVCFNSISFIDNLQLQNETICQNNDIQVDATIPSGVTYTWLPTIGVSNPNIANPTFSPNSTTIYTVTISDICGDTTVDDFLLVVLPVETPTFNSVGPICEGGSLTSLPTTSLEGITGTWSPTLNNTTTTTYTFTSNANSCANQTTLDIVVIPLTEPTFDAIDPICEGDTITALPTTSNNGITGTWSPALDNTVTTIYTFTPDFGQGCVDTTTLQIDVTPPTTPSFDTVSPVCEGDTMTPLPTTSLNGFTGIWSPALDNTTTTTYTFTPDAMQCAEIATLQIVVNTPINPTFDAVDTICEGDALAALSTTSNNGITGTWSPALDNSTTTIYTFTPSAAECANTTTLQIEVLSRIDPIFDAVPAICEGGILTDLPTTSNNGISGAWSPVLNNSATTTYTFTPNIDECANTALLTIDVTPNTTPTFDVVNPICPGEFLAELPLTSNNGITGTWSPALDNTITTIYTFTPDTGQGCVVNTTLEIVVTPPVVPTFNLPESICEDEITNPLPTISLEGITGAWSQPINNQMTTTYTFTPDPNQCASSIEATIDVIPFSQLEFTIELISEAFSSNQIVEVTVTGGNRMYEYQLDNGPWVNNNTFMNITGCDDHIMKVRQIDGCSNIATDTFTVLDYPKFFTPNGDSDNPTWNINCLRDRPGTLITIFNRYGKLLKQISPNSPGWDGTFNGNLMPTSDYWFRADYFDDDGNATTFSSHFSLKR
ncbi:MAG: T9SS type B sorting domain-containing protein [Winogradskyella sp.]|uniref:lectin-like domain-containing protein n=1 Tax=Winogradskyella sp. TaxID=1883156 RepID=UPI0017BD0371|nr:T9SS type B sorting domain-containing protein [Winogradskyella sp.]MBT8244592.1 T9SS type B sorting domain-containing protein [Winogradskyella sp.]NNK22668.1 T9SS type B sorting domain-containing protein [Winogradskyella sp.]